jgi:hypothetical protein
VHLRDSVRAIRDNYASFEKWIQTIPGIGPAYGAVTGGLILLVIPSIVSFLFHSSLISAVLMLISAVGLWFLLVHRTKDLLKAGAKTVGKPFYSILLAAVILTWGSSYLLSRVTFDSQMVAISTRGDAYIAKISATVNDLDGDVTITAEGKGFEHFVEPTTWVKSGDPTWGSIGNQVKLQFLGGPRDFSACYIGNEIGCIPSWSDNKIQVKLGDRLASWYQVTGKSVIVLILTNNQGDEMAASVIPTKVG